MESTLVSEVDDDPGKAKRSAVYLAANIPTSTAGNDQSGPSFVYPVEGIIVPSSFFLE